jgi:hypothetical protein
VKNHIEKYLNLYAEKGPWKLTANSFTGIHHAVVIPALGEYPTILETLYSLSKNSPVELMRTLVVCVVNHRALPQVTEDEIANNRTTLSLLHALIQKETVDKVDERHDLWIAGIKKSKMRLAYVDASSAGLELPDKGGVGLARKIGMDLALSIMEYEKKGINLLLSLDADTWVEPNYLLEVRRHFSGRKRLVAVVPYAHRKSTDESIQAAIIYYESYLRYYVIGLKYARSPYAFHTIGSTIISSALGYAMVRGIPKRLAAEDFYFLNKLAKIQSIGFIEGTTVYPSPRLSSRTPFGTGKKIAQLIAAEGYTNLFYNPEIFSILRKWLLFIGRNLNEEGNTIWAAAERIDPALQEFLNEINFIETWGKLKKNFPQHNNLLKQFHAWFDGFKTLKLIHYLTDHQYPKIDVIKAVKIMHAKINSNMPLQIQRDQASAMEILAYLQVMEKAMQEPCASEISP